MNISCIFPYIFVLFTLCSANVNVLEIVFRNSSYESTTKWETCHIFKEGRLLVSVYNWSICNQNGHFIRFIQSSSFQGYDMKTSSAKMNSGRKHQNEVKGITLH